LDVRVARPDRRATVPRRRAPGDARGKPLLDATVVVFPANDKLWTFQLRFIKAAQPDQDAAAKLTLADGETKAGDCSGDFDLGGRKQVRSSRCASTRLRPP
jgi:hypothetical protein